MATADYSSETEPELEAENELPDLFPRRTKSVVRRRPTGRPVAVLSAMRTAVSCTGLTARPIATALSRASRTARVTIQAVPPKTTTTPSSTAFTLPPTDGSNASMTTSSALFGDYFLEFIRKAENESAAARLATLAVIADDLEGDLIENGVFRFVLDVDRDGESDGERTTGRTPKAETLNALLRVTRELRIGKDAEGVTGNDLPPKAWINQHFSNYVDNELAERDELPWREGQRTLGTLQPEDDAQDRSRRPPTSSGPRGDVEDLLDRM